MSAKPITWATAITTVPSRTELFNRTLESLKSAGFDSPNLVSYDGSLNTDSLIAAGCNTITTHCPNVKTAGNWILTAIELYLRNPISTYYLIVQDDVVFSRNVRNYLECCKYPESGYWNLYTFPQNQKLCPKNKTGWYKSNQRGFGACALAFNRETLIRLFTHQHLYDRATDPKRGHKAIDGGIVTALKKCGYQEYIHNPSLVQHIGLQSSMANKQHPQAISFRGEQFDALDLPPPTIDCGA